MKHGRSALAGAVKEALDNLPAGVCFFDSRGLLVLCNRRMYALAFDIMGRDLQLLSELQEALDHLPVIHEGDVTPRGSFEGISAAPVAEQMNVRAVRDGELFILPDGTAWRFTQSEIRGEDGAEYTQVFAADVTELYRRDRELAKNNEQLEAVANRLRKITRNVAAIAREEEILALKMRIHDELGESLLALQTCCLNGFPEDRMPELIDGWRQTIRLLQDGMAADEETDPYEELLDIAASLGLTIRQTGSLPREEAAARLLTAAVRECVTNAVRHAAATEMYVAFDGSPSAPQLRITNNGIAPKGEITEGGGLSSLRRRVENAGGSMVVRSEPAFELLLRLPANALSRKEPNI